MARAAAFVLLSSLCALRAHAGGRELPLDVIPCPKQVSFEQGAFPVDQYCVVLVSEQATRGTRRAARAIQLGIRERFGLDLPILRVVEQHKHGTTRPIWVVEPRLLRPPAKTIGVKGVEFTKQMFDGGYYIRVDAVEAVVHGANDAGSLHGAHTFLQLIRPPRRGSLFRRGRPPAVPCLWIRDWPSQPVRAIPASYGPADLRMIGTATQERLIELGAHYKLNALPKRLLPADPALAARLRELAAWRGVRVVEQPPVLGDAPLRTALAGELHLRLALAIQAELTWGPPDPDPETFRRRFALDAANYPMPAKPARRPEPKRDPLADDEDKEGEDKERP